VDDEKPIIAKFEMQFDSGTARARAQGPGRCCGGADIARNFVQRAGLL